MPRFISFAGFAVPAALYPEDSPAESVGRTAERNNVQVGVRGMAWADALPRNIAALLLARIAGR